MANPIEPSYQKQDEKISEYQTELPGREMAVFKRRNPITACLLSFFTGGLGQVYNGQLNKGLLFFGGSLLLTGLLLSAIDYHLYGLLFIITVSALFSLWIIIDAMIGAIKQKKYQLKPYNKWYIYLGVLLIVLCLLDPIFSSLIPVKAYSVGGTSMKPTLVEGDRIVIGRFFYRSHPIERGDLIVFEVANRPGMNYIKRIAALGGEKLAIERGKVYINGVEIKKKWANFTDEKGKTLITARDSSTFNVPKNTVFVLGDNLDYSLDSRDPSFGPVSIRNINGKVLFIYWSNDRKKIGWEF